MKILYAEDEPILRDEIAIILGLEGHMIDVAEDGQAAWEMLNERSYEMLITDLKMPRMSGWELIERIRQSGDDQLTIVVTSAYSQFEQTVDFVKLGVSAYLQKPFSLTELIGMLA